MGGVFAKALLSTGTPVYPVLRSTDVNRLASELAEPALVLVAVGEDDLGPTLREIPQPWRRNVGLIQNELLPRSWEEHGIANPTVAPVWFEKKPGQDVKVVIATPVAGPKADLVVAGLTAIGIPAHRIGEDELLDALVVKNLYILTSNIAGLRTDGTVAELWDRHRSLASSVAREVLRIQEALTGRPLEAEPLFAAMVAAFDGDPDHKTTGRSAPKRLARALNHAQAYGIEVPTLEEIGREHGLVF